MATKRTRKKTARPAKKPAEKRSSEAPGTKRSSEAPGAKPAKKRASTAPAAKRATRSRRQTVPARPRAKKAVSAAASASESRPTPVPVPRPSSAPPSAPRETAPRPSRGEAGLGAASYLDGVPQDHAELVSGLLRVFWGVAKDIKTLVIQAIALTHHKNDRPHR
jgi:hypothetical protein